MKKKAIGTLIVATAFLITASGCSTYAAVKTAESTVMESTSVEQTKELTETAAETTAAPIAATATETKEPAAPTPTQLETTAVTTTAAPVVTTKPTTKPTSKPTVKESTVATTKATTAAATTAPAATTAAITGAPAYFPNADNIRNLIIAKLQAKGLWFPDAATYGFGSANIPTDYYLNDDGFANHYVNGKYGEGSSSGCASVTVVIDGDYVLISSTACVLPST